MKRSLILAGLFLLAWVCAWAQQAPCAGEPRSKMEQLASEVGVLLIRGTTRVGQIRGVKGGFIVIKIEEFKEAASGKRATGITAEVVDMANPEAKNKSYIDYEDISELMRVVDFFSKTSHALTKLDEYQAVYRTHSGLEISIRSIQIGEGIRISSIDNCGRFFSVFLGPGDMPALKDLLVTAQAKLDELDK